MMSTSSESGCLKGELYCDLCNYIQFSTYTDWQVHHLTHLRQPVVPLVKLNRSLCSKLLQGRSYILNTGVARSSQHHVPPLKISLIKQGARTFTVKQEILFFIRIGRLGGARNFQSEQPPRSKTDYPEISGRKQPKPSPNSATPGAVASPFRSL